LRALSTFSITKRSSWLKQLANKNKIKDMNVLDYGSGTGSHGISCLYAGAAHVDFLDVDGPLRRFAEWRVEKRQFKNYRFLNHNDPVVESHYDLVVCLDVMEHLADPFGAIKTIHRSLKTKSLLALNVSVRHKSSVGHFKHSIEAWDAKGLPFLSRNFTKISNFMWKKK
jgi:2-polyprenyl-3-methyl-5-hydroxy-6-metoxy-1,4-benzoquinol methylase